MRQSRRRPWVAALTTAAVALGLGATAATASAATADGPASPSELKFQKQFETRNYFNSEVPLDELGADPEVLHTSNPGADVEVNGGGVTMTNPTGEAQQSFVRLGDLYPYSAVDLDEQAADGAVEPTLSLRASDADRVDVRHVPASTDDATRFSTASLDLTDPAVVGSVGHERLDTTSVGLEVSTGAGRLILANPAGATEESYVRVGGLQPGTVSASMDVVAQQNASYTANAILSLGRSVEDRVVVVQRDASASNVSMSVEVFSQGKSVLVQTLSSTATPEPYDLGMTVDGSTLRLHRTIDGTTEQLGSVDLSTWFDLSDPTVRSAFSVYAGARLGGGERLELAGAQVYRDAVGTGLLDAASYTDEPQDHPVATDTAAPLTIAAADGLTFNNAGGTTAESVVRVGDLDDGTVVEAEVSDQSHTTYTATAILELRRSHDDRVVIAQRDGDAGNTALTVEVFRGGTSVLSRTVSTSAAPSAYTLAARLSGGVLELSWTSGGTVTAFPSVDLRPAVDLSTAAGRTGYVTYAGARLGAGESLVLDRVRQSRDPHGSSVPQVVVDVVADGKLVTSQAFDAPAAPGPHQTIRAHLNGEYLAVHELNGETSTYLGLVKLTPAHDLRTRTERESFAVYGGATVPPGASVRFSLDDYLTAGTGQADPKVLHDQTGAPIVEGSTMWIAMTTRGYEPIPASHQGLYSYDLETHEFSLVGSMSFDRGDGTQRPWHASDIFLDRRTGQWHVVTTSHGDDHGFWGGVLDDDPREGGYMVAQVSKLDYPSAGNEEDASLIYDTDAGAWRMSYVKTGAGGYQTYLAEAPAWNGPYTDIAHNDRASTTGSVIQRIGGRYYVFVGRGVANFEVLSYPDLEPAGTLDLDQFPTGQNVWPVIFPQVTATGTQYHLLSFDRDQVTGRYSYGDLFMYDAQSYDGFFENAPPSRALDVSVTAESRCLAGKAYVAVRATNGEDAPVDLTLRTAFGTRSFAGLAEGRSGYQSFAVRATSVEAGTATVTAEADVDGTRVSAELDAHYEALACG